MDFSSKDSDKEAVSSMQTLSENSLRLKFLHWNILADKLAHDSFPKVD